MLENEMKVTLPGISVQRKDGTIVHYRNSEYVPFFYMIPKEVIEYFGKEFMDIPREPYALFNYKDIKAKIERDLFIDFISNVTEFMVWNFMERGKSSYVYSGYEPAWIFSRSVPVWVKGFMDYNGLVSVKLLYQWCQARPGCTCSYVSLDKLDLALNNVVPKVMEQYNMKAILDVAKEYRSFEDYNDCDSNQRTDFFRKWYHNRTKHPQISLDGYMEEYKKNHNGQSWNPKDPNQNTEEEIISEVMVKQFTESLSEKDRKILEMRLEGYTQEEIADNLLKREFYAEKPFEKLTTDVTQFKVCNEKVYLSPVMDLFNREIVSYSISLSPNLWQIREMLDGLFKKLPTDATPLFHSDQGWQYQHAEYQRLLAEHNITQSMSRKGNCMDNGAMENFFGRLKVEMFYGEKFESVTAFIDELKKYIDYYNNERISMKLKGMSPVQYRTHSQAS